MGAFAGGAPVVGTLAGGVSGETGGLDTTGTAAGSSPARLPHRREGAPAVSNPNRSLFPTHGYLHH